MRSASRVFFRKSESHWLLVLTCFVLAGIGLFEMKKGGSALIMAAASANWPVAQGLITKSTIGFYGGNPGEQTCEPVILYSYTVEGHSYLGNGISPGLGVQSVDLARYPEGSVHNVYYRPSDPAAAYLEPGMQPGFCSTLLVGSLLFTFGSSLLAASCLIPKYGKRRPDGKTYTLPSSHPLAKASTVAMLLMALQFAELMYLSYQGYIAK